ncbi:type I DNA topoisomerase [Mycoplasma marinum]|uniref:DNA topoisomerase 1 n=1 Tax=Mycoplasma marinum TaxID=1937190 RepID=A0A4R0XN34_9MOLU|nr:type I DNA topoisomerase [Mycoplasma marinum]TCG10882.1 type I DNA topoisomerase [Mycoplasma marinum]
MNNKLVIVESPNKIKSIEKYLGEEYTVMASVGHIVKLPSVGLFRLGIDTENWEPKYKVDPGKKTIVAEMKKKAEKADIVYIATDPDREGEAIGDNLVEYLGVKEKYKRIRFNEITKDAVNKAINKPSIIDADLVDSQKTRKMLDRIIGYRLSTLMAQKMSNYPTRPTAGRVQSIALKLIVEREALIDAFVPVHYFNIEAKINEEVSAKYYNPVSKETNKEWIMPEQIDEVFGALNGPLTVDKVKITKRKDPKRTPFKQAVLYKSAESSTGLSSRQIQSAAQKLYEGFGDGGLISYPRTDSTRMSDTFVKQAKQYIADTFGKEYVATDIKGVAGDQDAHEAIRPTNLELTPEKAKGIFTLKPAEFKVYQVIYNRTMQALMVQPEREILRYELVNGDHRFKMSASKVIFDGYFKVTGYKNDNELPVYKEGEVVNVAEYIKEAKATQPPARYNEGSIIEKMDEIGVGRPSTFAATVNKIKEREYVEKEGRALKPTDFGKVVNGKLTSHFKGIINEDYTAKVEKELDFIAEGQTKYKIVMQDFWDKFNEQIELAQDNMEHTKLIPISASEEPCPDDGGQLIFKRSRKGDKFIACANWPNCTYTASDPNKKKWTGKRNWTKKK